LAYTDGDVIYTKYYKPSRNKKISWEVRAMQDTGLGTWFLRNKCNIYLLRQIPQVEVAAHTTSMF